MCAIQLNSSQRVFISGYFEPGSEGKEEKSKKSTREGGEIAGNIPSAYLAAPQGRKARMPSCQ
jgi:hypothetical protein